MHTVRSKKHSRLGFWHLQRLWNGIQPHTLQKGKLRSVGRKSLNHSYANPGPFLKAPILLLSLLFSPPPPVLRSCWQSPHGHRLGRGPAGSSLSLPLSSASPWGLTERFLASHCIAGWVKPQRTSPCPPAPPSPGTGELAFL